MMQGILSLNTVYESRDRKNALFCLPGAISNQQATRIVLRYLKDHPESLHLNVSILAIRAFNEAYPCK